jgi:hypothetical protein
LPFSARAAAARRCRNVSIEAPQSRCSIEPSSSMFSQACRRPSYTRTGSPVHVRRSWPQEHIALRVVTADPSVPWVPSPCEPTCAPRGWRRISRTIRPVRRGQSMPSNVSVRWFGRSAQPSFDRKRNLSPVAVQAARRWRRSGGRLPATSGPVKIALQRHRPCRKEIVRGRGQNSAQTTFLGYPYESPAPLSARV